MGKVTTSERGSQSIHPEPGEPGTPRSDGYFARVMEADAEAETAWESIREAIDSRSAAQRALLAIAAELRAARIARRPGAGQ